MTVTDQVLLAPITYIVSQWVSLTKPLRALAGAGCLAAVLAGCTGPVQKPDTQVGSQPVPTASFMPVSFSSLPGWGQDHIAEAFPAFLSSCARLETQNSQKPFGPPDLTLADHNQFCRSVQRLHRTAPNQTESEIQRQFMELVQPYAVFADAGHREGLFTGYYEADLRASRTRQPGYDVPVYGPPEDLEMAGGQGQRRQGGTLVPYYDRAAIETGMINGRAPVLMWADDPVDLFVLHIQGSGRVQFADGSSGRIGYAANNGHKFVGIGRLMRDRGLGDGSDMRSIRQWLKDNPVQAQSLMRENPRYIFFRTIDGPGPIGAHGVPLTGGRSLAVDPASIPLGSLMWVSIPRPDAPIMQKVMVAQDVGSAIKGPVRGDVFFGSGESALEQAGGFANRGRYYLLSPKKNQTFAGPFVPDVPDRINTLF